MIYQFEYNEEILTIIFYRADLVRIVYTEDKGLPEPSPGVILERTEVNVIQNDRILKTGALKVVVMEDLKVEIYDHQNNLLSKDNSRNKDEMNREEDIDSSDITLDIFDQQKDDHVILTKAHLFETGFYGLGEKYNFINFLDNDTANWCTDVLAVSPIHTAAQKEYHTAINFYIGMNENLSYGIYYDNTYRTYFNFAKNSNHVTFKAAGGFIDYYFIQGDSVNSIVEKYTELTGKMPLPRRQFLGYQQSRWSYKTKDILLKTARRMYQENIPCDVFYLDIDYMDDYKVFTIDSKDFKEFKKMTQELKSMGYKLVTIIDPGIKKQQGYKVYDEGLTKDYFIRDKENKIYIGDVWPGDSVFPDFMRAEVRQWWGALHEVLIDNGVDGIWNDMNEIADMSTKSKTLPETAIHKDDQGNERLHKEVHNIYAHLEAQATYKGLLTLQKNKRPFVLTRAAFAGTQRYAAIWTGDNTSIWEHLEATIPMVMNLNLSGFSFSGPDVGGFLEASTGELLTRFTQLGAFLPLFRNHCAYSFKLQEPWQYDETTLVNVKKSIELRYTFIPYLYNLMVQNAFNGTPVIKPLFIKYQEDVKTHNINDQFLFGDSILVCPITRPKTDRRMVYLPKGTWYDFYTDEQYSGQQYIIVEAPLDQIPLFIKAGSIIPRQSVVQNLDGPLTTVDLHIYKGRDTDYEFYWDDGFSFDYTKGEFNRYRFTLKDDKISKEIIQEQYQPMSFNYIFHG